MCVGRWVGGQTWGHVVGAVIGLGGLDSAYRPGGVRHQSLVRTCAPCRGGNPPLVDGGVGCPPVGLGVKGAGSEKLQEVGTQVGYLTAGGKLFLLCESRTGVPLLTSAAAPRRPSHAGMSVLHTKPLPSLEGALHHIRCGKCKTGPGGSGSPTVHRWCTVRCGGGGGG